MKNFLRIFALSWLLSSPAFAGSGTIAVLDGGGVSRTYDVITDGTGNFVGKFGMCDQAAAAQCATVTAGNAVKVDGSAVTQPVSAAALPLPTGAATAAGLTTINTTLGTPFQAGGSIGNTTFAATQATAASLNATVVGTGTFATQLTGATNNINNIAGTITLPTLASTSTKQSDGSQKTQIVDGSGNVIASTSNNLNVQCANCSGSGVSAADAATFTAGTSLMAPAGGQFTSGGAAACVTGHECTVGITAARAFLTDTSSIAGTTALTGNGTTGAGSQRVTIASDNTPFNIGVAQGSTTSGQSGPLSQGAVTTSAPTYTTAQTSPLSLDTAGNLRVVGTGIAQGSTTSGQTGSIIFGAVTTASPTYTTAQSSPLSLDTSGSLRVAIISGGGSGGTSLADAATFTAGTTAFTPFGGQFTSGGATACVTGHACWAGMTAARGIFTDLSSVNGVTTLTGTGAVGTGAQRIAVGTDTATIAGSAPGTAGAASANVVTVQGVASMTPVATNIASGGIASGAVASGAIASGAVASGAIASGAFASGSFLNATAGDPCMFQAKTNVPISTATGTVALVAAVSAKKVYVCSFSIVAAASVAVSLSEGSGATCGTSNQAGVIGVATNGTAANGLSLAANGGLTLGNGGGVVAQTATANNTLCLFQSGTVQLAGNLTYVQQ